MDTLLNWLWQGLLVAAAATILLKTACIRSAEWRYRFWWTSMAVVLILPAIAAVAPTPLPLPAAGNAGPGSETAYLPDVHVSDLAIVVMIVVAAWAAWIAVYAMRTFVALLALRRLRRRCTPFPAEREARLHHWMTVRPSSGLPLVLSDDVGSAAVVGLSDPVIAVSSRLLAGLTDDQLDRVLVHEWAHIQRRDHIAHAGQLMIRVLAGCHPAIWLIDRRLEAERESACDEMAIRVTGTPRAYAACLARLAEISSVPSPSLPVPAAASSHVRSRIVRVLQTNGQRRERRLRLKVSAAAVAIGLIGLQAGSSALVLPAVEAAASFVKAPEMTSPPAAPTRPDVGVTATASRSARSKPRKLQPAVFGQIAAATDSPAAEPQPSAIETGERPPARIEPLPLAATLDMNAIPNLRVTAAPVQPPAPEAASPWSAAKNTGTAIGRGSQKAAVSTAGFFTRFGKNIAGSF